MVLICLFLCRSVSLHFPHPVCILFRSFNLAAFHLLLPYLASSFPFLVLFLVRPLNIARPSPQGYTSLLQMFRPSQI